jgi:structure-specific endonuclease subunit SLX1
MDLNLREHIDVTLDPNAFDHYDKATQKIDSVVELGSQQQLLNGVENLDFGYSSMKAHVEKSKLLLAREGNKCSVCAEDLRNGESMLLTCAHDGCEAVSHLHCLSQHFLSTATATATAGWNSAMLPVEGSCQSCKKKTKWQTLVKELTLRTRGSKELAVLFRKPRAKKAANGANTEAAGNEFMTIEEIEENESEGFRDLEEFEAEVIKEALEDNLPDTAGQSWPAKERPKSRRTAAGSRMLNERINSPMRKRGSRQKESVADRTG